MHSKRSKVAVAMSGGVDSSVAAALLIEQGYDVIGVTLNVWPSNEEETERGDSCCGLSAVEDARRVADLLGIPHYTLNLREDFAEAVISDFVAEYRHGRTPNPCIRCNEFIKFTGLLRRISGLEADYLATGHYARIEYDSSRGRFVLRKANDRRKDQSYVLYVLTQDVLARTLLPLGNMTKEETRRIARQLGLPNAARAESQEICFIPDNDYTSFLRQAAPEVSAPGPICDTDGKKIGEHGGIAGFTIGQRRRLGLSGRSPSYVVALDPHNSTVTVGAEGRLYHRNLVADKVNLVSEGHIPSPKRVAARVRYRGDDVPAVMGMLADGRLGVRFDEPQRAITPGQAVVCYDGDVVVAGGTIESVADSLPLDARDGLESYAGNSG